MVIVTLSAQGRHTARKCNGAVPNSLVESLLCMYITTVQQLQAVVGGCPDLYALIRFVCPSLRALAHQEKSFWESAEVALVMSGG